MGTLRDLQFALQLKIEELRQRDTLIDELELELDTKDELIRRLQEELDRYRATVSVSGSSAASRLIQAAFLKNDLLKNLGVGEIRAIISCMYSTSINQGCYVIQEGTNGAQAYVLEEGRLDVKKDRLTLVTIEPGDVFGELALLYNCTHNYSVSGIKVLSKERLNQTPLRLLLWMTSYLLSLYLFVCSVPFLQSLPEDVMMKLSDLTEETHYTEGDYVIRQGATGDTFYIISKGQVNLFYGCCTDSMRLSDRDGEKKKFMMDDKMSKELLKLLYDEDIRTVNVIAAGDVTCLVIDSENCKVSAHLCFFPFANRSDKPAELPPCSTLNDFQILCTLGDGEFSHVDLVQLKSNIKCHFAMRVLKKKMIVNNGQREHVLRELHVLMETHSSFIVRCLSFTFRDAENLYMLTEACLGGDFCILLRDRGFLDEYSTRFYTGCVVEALTFLHCQGVIYRDVKPENVVLDEHGYAKLIGSGCVKKVEVGKKTWTFCGTPGYMAPEVILNQGHTISADLWSLGIFVFELLTGSLPFCGPEPLKILTATIRGIDQIDFPKTISKSASSLIKKLCRNNPSERLGCQRNGAKDIQKHKWFEGFDWDGLCRGMLNPPIIPKVKLPLDNMSCSHYPEDSVELCTSWDDF
uniref:cGMP-dependent protein kinase n=1 Tax=Sphaeramia orbicularis TaxID=375764 RepID=A0A673AV25_9TELE